jgi:hypoxanthine-guanine phosphoribosyltransferase
VGIAEGGLPFTKLLSAFLEVPHELTFLRRDAGGSFLLPLEIPLKQIILADCIFDTGKTFLEASDLLNSKGAMTRGAVLLMRGRDLDISLRYPQHVGFWVPGNEFFVGFGLDDKEGKSRELPDIYTEGEI